MAGARYSVLLQRLRRCRVRFSPAVPDALHRQHQATLAQAFAENAAAYGMLRQKSARLCLAANFAPFQAAINICHRQAEIDSIHVLTLVRDRPLKQESPR